jgi:PAS domain S-box-containing protein
MRFSIRSDDNSHVSGEDWLQATNRAGFGIAIVASADARILALNHAFAKMHGYDAMEMIGRTLDEFTVKGSRRPLGITIRTSSGEAPDIYESVQVRKDGTTFARIA